MSQAPAKKGSVLTVTEVARGLAWISVSLRSMPSKLWVSWSSSSWPAFVSSNAPVQPFEQRLANQRFQLP